MSQSRLATSRIMLPYTTSGITHKAYAYCKANLVGSDWMIDDRAGGGSTLAFEDCADAWGGSHAEISVTSDTVFGTLELQQKSGSSWVTKAVKVYPGTPSGGGSLVTCSQVTLTLRDSQFNKIKVVMLDTSVGYPNQIRTPTAGSTAMDNFIKHFNSDNTAAADPYNWIVSLSNHFLTDEPFVSVSVTLSHLVERMRGF